MRIVVPILWAGLLALTGCRSASDVANSSYTAATAPASTTTTTTTTTTGTLDQTTATGEPRTRPTPHAERTETTTAETKPPSTETKPPPESTPRPVSTEDFPTAKPVEGKPGYVYSPFDPGKYVDVSGYPPGSKVKDPYSGKIFKVP